MAIPAAKQKHNKLASVPDPNVCPQAMLGWESCKAAMQHAMESFKGNSTWKEISAVCQEKLLPLPRLSELVLGIIREIMDGEKYHTV